MKLPHNWNRKWIKASIKWKEFKKKGYLFSHYIQDDIYEIDKYAYPWLRAFTGLLTLLVVASILIPIGFELSPPMRHLEYQMEKWLLVGFAINVGLRIFLTSERKAYLKKRWFEVFLSVFAVFLVLDLNFSFVNIVDSLMVGVRRPEALLLQLVKGYLLLLVLVKVLHNLPYLLDRQKNTGRLLVYGFLLIILVGALFLMLPGATLDGQGLSFINALFTSTSAVCVTGLIVVDTATHFTLFGKVVIMTLIQLGGIGIVTLATFLFLYISGGLGVSQMNVIKNVVAEENTNLLSHTLKRVIGFIFVVEAIGATAYYFSWPVAFESAGQRVFFSAFHAISAFCNAGFSLFTNSLADPVNALHPAINIITMLLIILGGLGFTSIWEIIYKKITRASWRNRLSIHTRTVLITTAVLIVGGAGCYLALEWNNTLGGYSWTNKVMVSFFQSITTRTAGFNSVDTGAIGISATLVMCILMFIGGSPASTAGGIKTTTFAVLLRSISTTVRGYSRMEFFKRTVPNHIVFQAMAVVLLALSCISISTILLTITEKMPFLDLLFEEISAFATVGLSRGITADLSSWGKFIIIVSMFWGRVGILTFTVAFAKKADNRKYKYPEETLMVS